MSGISTELFILCFLLVVAGYFNTPFELIFLTEEFFTPLYLLSAVFIGVGLFTILKELAEGKGPVQGMLVLGYAGWSPGQLESEIETGSWIVVPASKQLVFDTDNETKWNVAVSSLGFDMGHYSTVVGHA